MTLGALCGVTAAIVAATTVIAGEPVKPAAMDLAGLAQPVLAGRWSGRPHQIRHDPSRCDGDDCQLVIDIVPCAAGWCGIEVTKGQTCAGEVMQLAAMKAVDRASVFEGTFSLGKDTQNYVVEAYLKAPLDGAPARLQILGDTGPEFRMFRRSFPFQATLARTGEASCKSSDKPVS